MCLFCSLQLPPFLQEVVNGIEELQHHKNAMDKIPLLVSMEKIPTQMTQLFMQVLIGGRSFMLPLVPPSGCVPSHILSRPCRTSNHSFSTAQIARCKISMCAVQKMRGCIPEERIKQMQTIVAQRRRHFAKQQSQVRFKHAVLKALLSKVILGTYSGMPPLSSPLAMFRGDPSW